MKKVLIALLVLCFAATAFGLDPSAFNSRTTFRNGYAWGGHQPKDKATLWAQQVEGAVEIGQRLGTGSVFYVDSGALGSVNGLSWTDAVLTLDAAINLCTNDRGDFILLAQGHNEALVASGADADISGITIIGVGDGSLMPTFDYDVNSGTFDIGAANVTLVNLRFRASVTAVVSGINVQGAGDNVQILGCEFGFGEAYGTDEFNTAISFDTGADGGLVQGCLFDSGPAGAVQAIQFQAVSGCIIQDNDIRGVYSVANLKNVGAAEDIIIRRNLLFNGSMGGDGEINSEPAIEFAEGTSGFVADNRIVSAVATALLMRVADDMVFMNNFVSDTDGDEFSGVMEAGYESTVDSISGHADG